MGGDVVEMRDRLGLAPLIPAPKEDNTPVSSDEECEAPIAGVEIATERMRGSGTNWGGPYLINFGLHLVGDGTDAQVFVLRDCAYREDLAGVCGAPASEASSSSESSSTSISTS